MVLRKWWIKTLDTILVRKQKNEVQKYVYIGEGHKMSLNSGRTNGAISLWRYRARSIESPAGIRTEGRFSALKESARTPRFRRLNSFSGESQAVRVKTMPGWLWEKRKCWILRIPGNGLKLEAKKASHSLHSHSKSWAWLHAAEISTVLFNCWIVSHSELRYRFFMAYFCSFVITVWLRTGSCRTWSCWHAHTHSRTLRLRSVSSSVGDRYSSSVEVGWKGARSSAP